MSKTKWILDPGHSEIYFKVKHLMITTVTGFFRKFYAEAYSEEDDFIIVSDILFTADVNSIDTNNIQRDEHLVSADFFDAAENKQIKFSGNRYERKGSAVKLFGDLVISGITNPVKIDVEFGGVAVDGYGQTKAGFTVSGKISRKEFGLTWGPVTEAGNVVVGDEVKFHGEIQLIKQV